MQNFIQWLENTSLNAQFPELASFVNNQETSASDEVKRTNLQPQVDGGEQVTSPEEDKILAIDGDIERMTSNLPKENSEKVNKFKNLWEKMRSDWEKIKRDNPNSQSDGLGNQTGDENYVKTMQQNPNMVPNNHP